jgi:hypothetical protein
MTVRALTMFEEFEWRNSLTWVYLQRSRGGRERTLVQTTQRPYFNWTRPASLFYETRDIRD